MPKAKKEIIPLSWIFYVAMVMNYDLLPQCRGLYHWSLYTRPTIGEMRNMQHVIMKTQQHTQILYTVNSNALAVVMQRLIG